jgi:hypothetical protein
MILQSSAASPHQVLRNKNCRRIVRLEKDHEVQENLADSRVFRVGGSISVERVPDFSRWPDCGKQFIDLEEDPEHLNVHNLYQGWQIVRHKKWWRRERGPLIKPSA